MNSRAPQQQKQIIPNTAVTVLTLQFVFDY